MVEERSAAAVGRRTRAGRRRGAPAVPLVVAIAAGVSAGIAAPRPSDAQVRRAAMPVTATVPAAPCGTAGADPACTVVVRTVRVADATASTPSAPSPTWITATSVDASASAVGGRLLVVVTHVY